mmetsp:Transcript_54376/g.140456  ORF Transcript_54376/g.140456 Transcript_54376/m.140456 type:complete len:243 (-) Transcript_54376:438-1166(-)
MASTSPADGTRATLIPVIEREPEMMDKQATALRQSCVFLLIFSLISAHHLQGWLGLYASISILCASSVTISRRACRAKFCATISAGFALIAFAFLVGCVVAGIPYHLSQEIHAKCKSMPSETVEWGKALVTNHDYLMHQHVHNEDIPNDPHRRHGPHSHSLLSAHRMLQTVAKLVSPEHEQACDELAHIVADFGAVILLAGALAQFGLLLSAVVVARRACLLRRYRACVPTVVVASPLVAKP